MSRCNHLLCYGLYRDCRFLDMRHTGIARHVLAPLQRRFALQFVQAVVRGRTPFHMCAETNGVWCFPVPCHHAFAVTPPLAACRC